MKGPSIAAALLLAAGTAAYAQESPARPPQTPVPEAGPAAARVPGPSADVRRRDIKFMEGILTNAVRQGAAELGQKMQIAEPGSVIVTGTARARGIALDGYGVLFDVDVPMMKQSVIWTTRQLIQLDLREKIDAVRQAMARTNDPEELRRASLHLRFLQAQLQSVMPGAAESLSAAATGSGFAAATPVANGATPPSGVVTAQTAPETVSPVGALDPNELYTDAVKRSLIDAMLNYSVALKLGDDEWLTVAARDAEGPLTAGAIDEAVTIMIRVKGSDLSAFHLNKLSREEVLKRVDVREF